MSEQLAHLLEGYSQFATFDPRELVLIESLRTLRMIHYSAWLARRWSDPAFPAAFPWFIEPRYWENQVLALREQLAAIAEGPLELLRVGSCVAGDHASESGLVFVGARAVVGSRRARIAWSRMYP